MDESATTLDEFYAEDLKIERPTAVYRHLKSDEPPIREPQSPPIGLNRPNGPAPGTAGPVQDLGTWLQDPELGADALRKIALARVAEPPPGKQRLRVAPGSRFLRQQEWLGRVEAIEKDGFRAVLSDLMRITDDEEAFLSWYLVQPDDEPLVKEGALFYWVIGYRLEGNTRRGESRVLFKRSIGWSTTERDEAEAEAERLWRAFSPDD